MTKFMLLVGVSLAFPAAAQANDLVVWGSHAEAGQCYRQALSDVPRPDALADCNIALQDDSLGQADRLATYVNRGVVKNKLGQFDSAIADFDYVLTRDPRQPDALINKGLAILGQGGSVGTAISLFNTGIAGKSQMPWVGYYGRAFAHEVAREDVLAYQDYQRALALRPEWKLPKTALARFQVR